VQAREPAAVGALSTDPRIGSELAAYRIEALVGRGGMGVVYRAHDLALDRSVALKLLTPELADDVPFRERFLRESRLAASLEHPNVVPIHDAGEIDRQLYIAMRLVEGTDLKALLRAGPLEPARAVQVLGQVAAALDTAHARGLVHRDVKPSNVLVTTDDHAYLADFGLTRRLGESGAAFGAAQSLGTVDYVAPEQIRGEEIDGSADLYSLGCLLHECLTGQPPFRRSSEAATLFAHLEEDPPGPPGLEGVMGKALAKEPADRYASGGELVEATRSALGLSAPRRSRWPLVVASLGLAMIAAALLAFFLVRGSPGAATTGRVVRIDAATGKVAGTVRVGNDPRAIAAGPGSVWVANYGDSTVSKLDPATSRVETIAVNGPPLSLGVSEGVVLVASGPPANSLTLIRARGGSAYDIVPLKARPAGATSLVAAGPAGVWIVDKERWTVTHVSLRGGNDFRVVAQRRLRLRHPLAELNSVAVGKNAVWLAGNTVDRRILKLDPQTARVVATVRLSVAPRRVTVGEGAVWVTGEIDNVVLRIDPHENRVVARIRVGRGGSGVAAGGGSVWVANGLDGTITRIDPHTNRIAETIRVGGSPHDLVVAGGGVWVAKGRE
jgi:YVTN family beta-propeller protein